MTENLTLQQRMQHEREEEERRRKRRQQEEDDNLNTLHLMQVMNQPLVNDVGPSFDTPAADFSSSFSGGESGGGGGGTDY